MRPTATGPQYISKTRKRRKNNYVNNAEFYEHLIEFAALKEVAKKKGEIEPRIPEKIGLIFYNISRERGRAANFRNYPFIEEMVADGYEDCVRRLHNFDPNKSKNPFAYFSQIIFFAFLRRIKAEKKYLYIKFKTIEHQNMFELNSASQSHDTKEYDDDIKSSDSTEMYMQKFIEAFESDK